MTNRQKVHALAKALDATIEVFEGDAICVSSPKGKIWGSGSVHELVAPIVEPWTRKPCKAGAWADLLERMECGLEPCPITECECCYPDHDFPICTLEVETEADWDGMRFRAYLVRSHMIKGVTDVTGEGGEIKVVGTEKAIRRIKAEVGGKFSRTVGR